MEAKNVFQFFLLAGKLIEVNFFSKEKSQLIPIPRVVAQVDIYI